MDEILLITLRIGLAVFASFVILKGIYLFFSPTEKKRYYYAALALYFIFQLLVCFNIGLSPLLVLIFNVVLVFILTLAFEFNIKKCLGFSIFIFVIWMLSEVIAGALLRSIQLSEMDDMLVGSAITKISMLILILFPKRFFGNSKYDIPTRYWLTLLLIPMGSTYIMYNVFEIGFKTQEYRWFTLICASILLCMNIIIFSVYEKISEYMEIRKRNLLYEQQLDLCNQNMAERESQDQAIQCLRHDMKEHLVSLHGMAEKNNCSDIITYIKSLMPLGGSYNENDVSLTGNVVIDSLINYKCNLARSESAEIRANIIVPVVLPIQAGDVSIIIGNLLENALEACRSVEATKRFIEINITYEKKMLFIMVKNPFKGERMQGKNGVYKTTKSGVEKHGLGLISIMGAIKRHNGELQTEVNADVFCSTVILYA